MKSAKLRVRRPRFRDPVLWARDRWQIVAEIATPGRRTVFVSHAGELPGREVPPDEQAAAQWSGGGWIVPAAGPS